MTDVFSAYESGLEELLRRLTGGHHRYTEALTLQSRLLENISQTRHYGDTETRRSDRAQIIEALNRLASQEMNGLTFDKLARVEGKLDETRVLQAYLDYIIESNRLLKLHGIYVADQLINIELEKVYVPRCVLQTRNPQEEALLPYSWQQSLGDVEETEGEKRVEGNLLTVDQLLASYPRLVVLGSPGSGKTILLSYMALQYSRNLRDELPLGLPANLTYLPISLYVRDFAKQLGPDRGTDGPDVLLRFIHVYISSWNVAIPENFFDSWLADGNRRCLFLLDGIDEVADEKTRTRIARIIEMFTIRYPQNRYVVTSRVMGYRGSARLGAGYRVATLYNFTSGDIVTFVQKWNREAERFLSGDECSMALDRADRQSANLLQTISNMPTVQELAANPLLLTVVILVYRYRGSLPQRRAELYDMVVEVLLSQWDTAKGIDDISMLHGRALDTRDKRLYLESIAFEMHKRNLREMDGASLMRFLREQFETTGGDADTAAKMAEGFVRFIQERTSLLQEREQGKYGFAHLALQEYLAAVAVVSRDDYVPLVMEHLGDSWWREVIKLVVAKSGRLRVAQLLETILDAPSEPEPIYNLILVADCLIDAGVAQIPDNLRSKVQRRLQHALNNEDIDLNDRAMAGDLLGKIGDPRFMGLCLRSDFIRIPTGPFIMGSQPAYPFALGDELPQSEVDMPAFYIMTYPVTNAQYQRFLADMPDYPAPWSEMFPEWSWDLQRRMYSSDRANHPVVLVSWHDANAYCAWLTRSLLQDQTLPYELRASLNNGWVVRLPTETEWEKAARGPNGYEWPWGHEFLRSRANTREEGFARTTAAGIFPGGASFYGVMDMAGNVFEWTSNVILSSLRPSENVTSSGIYVLRGGAWSHDRQYAHCACRYMASSDNRVPYVGFRTVIAPLLTGEER